jgi:Zn-dependent metalloprotease
MKKLFLLIGICLLTFEGFSQENLRSLIRDTNGTSRHFVTLQPEDQAAFNPSELGELLGFGSNTSFILINTLSDQLGMTHYRFFQTYNGIPVENSMYVVHTRDNLITGLTGEIVVDFADAVAVNPSPTITPSEAIQQAINSMRASKYMWEDPAREQMIKDESSNPSATYYPTAKLVWYHSGEELNPERLTLAYKVDVFAMEPLKRQDIYIDASNGSVLGSADRLYHVDAVGTAATAYSGTVTIHSDLSGGTYKLRDNTKGLGVVTVKSGGGNYTSSSANWTLTGQDQYALDAHYGVSSTWSFFYDNFGRNSIDNAGKQLKSYVNDPLYTNNAAWDGSAMHFGKLSSGAGITAIDVCGHELTHGVTQYTCNLNYSYQSGAINESLSDIMGKSTQFYAKPSDINWKLSNDMNWFIRDMSNPNAYGQPDTYLGTNWYTGSGDNGGVHYNSGVGNFMYYLLVNGGSGTNDIGNAYSVTGIGLTDAQQIIYRTQTVYLVSTSQYSDWRTACVSAASDLFGIGSNQVTQVQNAWYAVGIGLAGGSGGSCGIPSGLSATAITSAGATLNWAAVPEATSYNVQYKPSSGSTWTVQTSSTTSKSISGLAPNTAYDYQVQAVCPAGNSEYSAISNFSTLDGPACAESYEPNNSKNTAVSISTDTDILSQVSSSTDNDWLKFSNTSSAPNMKITLTTLPYDYDIKFYNTAGTHVKTSENSNTTDETIIYNTSTVGTYKVKIYGWNGAYSTTQCYTLHVYTSNTPFRLESELAGSSPKDHFTIYPNPAADRITLQYDAAEAFDGDVRLLNPMGQIVQIFRQSLTTGDRIQMDLSQLPTGIYFVNLASAEVHIMRMIEIVR